jgi:WD40 repeat protein
MSKRIIEAESHARTYVFSPDRKTLACGYPDSRVKFRDAESGAVQFAFQPYETDYEIEHIRFAPNGRTVAIWGGPQHDKIPFPDVILWDPEKQQRVSSFPSSGLDVSDLAFSPDGRLLAISSKTDVKLWNVATRDIQATLVGDGWRHIICLAFSPDGKLLAGGTTFTMRPLRDAKVVVWEVPLAGTDLPDKN